VAVLETPVTGDRVGTADLTAEIGCIGETGVAFEASMSRAIRSRSTACPT
jgi:hypothetical protein